MTQPRGAFRKFDRLHVLVIGCGSIGKRHLTNLRFLGIKQISAYDINESHLESVKAHGVTTFSSLKSAWESHPDIAVIATPTSLHIPFALQAASYGCDIFIEKPLSHTMDGVDELLCLVKAKGLITIVGCNMRFHPAISAVKKMVKDGAVGKVLAAQVATGYYLPHWHPWEDYRKLYSARRDLGGGVILDAIHELDYVRWMLGEVKEVACFADRISSLDIDTEDVASIILRFASGAIAEVHLDYIQRVYTRTCRVIGEDGIIRWDWSEHLVWHYSTSAGGWQRILLPHNWNVNQMYIDEMAHFLECVLTRRESMCNVEEAKRTLRVALLAKESAFTKRILAVGDSEYDQADRVGII